MDATSDEKAGAYKPAAAKSAVAKAAVKVLAGEQVSLVDGDAAASTAAIVWTSETAALRAQPTRDWLTSHDCAQYASAMEGTIETFGMLRENVDSVLLEGDVSKNLVP